MLWLTDGRRWGSACAVGASIVAAFVGGGVGAAADADNGAVVGAGVGLVVGAFFGTRAAIIAVEGQGIHSNLKSDRLVSGAGAGAPAESLAPPPPPVPQLPVSAPAPAPAPAPVCKTVCRVIQVTKSASELLKGFPPCDALKGACKFIDKIDKVCLRAWCFILPQCVAYVLV
jgi:hypothetical protein